MMLYMREMVMIMMDIVSELNSHEGEDLADLEVVAEVEIEVAALGDHLHDDHNSEFLLQVFTNTFIMTNTNVKIVFLCLANVFICLF